MKNLIYIFSVMFLALWNYLRGYVIISVSGIILLSRGYIGAINRE